MTIEKKWMKSRQKLTDTKDTGFYILMDSKSKNNVENIIEDINNHEHIRSMMKWYK